LFDRKKEYFRLLFNLKSTGMKKLILAALVLTLLSCGKKEWSKDYVSKKCKGEMKKNEQSKVLSDEQLGKICDCAADKMVVKYKSEADADKDLSGSQEIGMACAMTVMTGGAK
jgi:hypothetical protein